MNTNTAPLAMTTALLCSSLAGCAQLPFELPFEVPQVAMDIPAPYVNANAYLVRPGDTVSNIAWRYQVAASDLVVWNNLQPPYDLRLGQALRVKGNRSTLTRIPSDRPSVASAEVPVGQVLPPSVNTKAVARVEIEAVSNPEPLVLAEPMPDDLAEPAQTAGETVEIRATSPAPSAPMAVLSAGVSAPSSPVAEPVSEPAVPSAPAAPVAVAEPPLIVASIDEEAMLDAAPQITLGAPQVDLPATAAATKAPSQAAASAAASAAEPEPLRRLSDWVWPAQGEYNTHKVTQADKGPVLDISGVRGQAVMAAAKGEVLYVGGDSPLGRLILVKHEGGFISAYSHNEQVRVEKKQRVAAGEIIAFMGGSGDGSAKLRFQLKKEGQTVDPLAYLPRINE